MKKVYWAGILAVISISICAICLIYVTNASDEAKNYVENIQIAVMNSEYDSAKEQAQALDDFWQKKHTVLSMLVHHKNLEKIEESVQVIKIALENTNDDNQIDCNIETTRALSGIKNLRDVELPSVSNIL